MLQNLGRPCLANRVSSVAPWWSRKVEWARTSCWMSRAGGLTSRAEYSTALWALALALTLALAAAGSWVRSMD